MTKTKEILSIISVTMLVLAILTGLGQLVVQFNLIWLWMAYTALISSIGYVLIWMIERSINNKR